MKLADLHPAWVQHGGEGVRDESGNDVPVRLGVGVAFNCPCGCLGRICVLFQNPLDGGPALENAGPLWARCSDSLDSLTLLPSIRRLGGCGWHGFITEGEALTC